MADRFGLNIEMKPLIFVSLSIMFFLSSCSQSLLTHEVNILDYWSVDPNKNTEIAIPYAEDFESNTFEYVVNDTPCLMWIIEESSANSYLKCVEFDEKKVVDGNPIFGLMIGDKTWSNYNFSFDFKLEGDTWVGFAPYADTNHEDSTPRYMDSDNSWSIDLYSAGDLYYSTLFSRGSRYIVKAPDTIPGYIKDDWNRVTIVSDGLDIVMELNGVSLGKVASIQEGITGRISIGGGVGCMIDNISVVPVSES